MSNKARVCLISATPPTTRRLTLRPAGGGAARRDAGGVGQDGCFIDLLHVSRTPSVGGRRLRPFGTGPAESRSPQVPPVPLAPSVPVAPLRRLLPGLNRSQLPRIPAALQPRSRLPAASQRLPSLASDRRRALFAARDGKRQSLCAISSGTARGDRWRSRGLEAVGGGGSGVDV